MAETSLKTIEWQEIMDYHLCLMLGGYNSNREYYDGGDLKEDIEKEFINIYIRSLEFVNSNTRLNSYGLEEDVLIVSSENQWAAACVWVNNSDDYREEREKASHLPEDKKDLMIDSLEEDMCTILSEMEYSSYHPYEMHPYIHFYTTRGFSFLNSEDLNGIYLVINDCQNSLCEETKMCYDDDSDKIAHYEYDLIEIAKTANFIRIPKEITMIGDGK